MNAASAGSLIILGIDPSLRSTGYAVLEAQSAHSIRLVSQGAIKIPQNQSHGQALLSIYQGLEEVVLTHRPHVAAIEKTIYVQSASVAITLGVTRGAILVLLERYKIPVFDYPPKSIKSAATGRGSAGKQAVALLVRAQFGMQTTPEPDAADAIAAALAHVKKHFFRQRIGS